MGMESFSATMARSLRPNTATMGLNFNQTPGGTPQTTQQYGTPNSFKQPTGPVMTQQQFGYQANGQPNNPSQPNVFPQPNPNQPQPFTNGARITPMTQGTNPQGGTVPLNNNQPARPVPTAQQMNTGMYGHYGDPLSSLIPGAGDVVNQYAASLNNYYDDAFARQSEKALADYERRGIGSSEMSSRLENDRRQGFYAPANAQVASLMNSLFAAGIQPTLANQNRIAQMNRAAEIEREMFEFQLANAGRVNDANAAALRRQLDVQNAAMLSAAGTARMQGFGGIGSVINSDNRYTGTLAGPLGGTDNNSYNMYNTSQINNSIPNYDTLSNGYDASGWMGNWGSPEDIGSWTPDVSTRATPQDFDIMGIPFSGGDMYDNYGYGGDTYDLITGGYR